jgi:uncharacterized protein YcbX
VLRQFRFDKNVLGVTFGQNARVEGDTGGILRVGDAVEVEMRRGTRPMPGPAA